MNTAALRSLIEQALLLEQRDGLLAAHPQALPGLHRSLRCTGGTVQALQGFVEGYVRAVPELLDSVAEMARRTGRSAALAPLLCAASQFFVRPPALMQGQSLLAELLDEAYLAHRLVEEVNDRYITHLGQPLIPLDTTVANVIAHQLIGEPFANQLDEAVHHAVDELLDEQVFQQDSVQEYRTRLSNPQTVAAWQNWPCLSRQLGVELGLPVSA